jgi:hypothetical protein
MQFQSFLDLLDHLNAVLRITLRGLSPQANYTDRLSDRRLSAKLMPTLADRGCRVVSATIPQQLLISVFYTGVLRIKQS